MSGVSLRDHGEPPHETVKSSNHRLLLFLQGNPPRAQGFVELLFSNHVFGVKKVNRAFLGVGVRAKAADKALKAVFNVEDQG